MVGSSDQNAGSVPGEYNKLYKMQQIGTIYAERNKSLNLVYDGESLPEILQNSSLSIAHALPRGVEFLSYERIITGFSITRRDKEYRASDFKTHACVRITFFWRNKLMLRVAWKRLPTMDEERENDENCSKKMSCFFSFYLATNEGNLWMFKHKTNMSAGIFSFLRSMCCLSQKQRQSCSQLSVAKPCIKLRAIVTSLKLMTLWHDMKSKTSWDTDLWQNWGLLPQHESKHNPKS